MKIKTTKEILYRKVKYRVDTEHELAFTPWVLREASKSFHFLHKRGLLQPTQEDLGLKEYCIMGAVGCVVNQTCLRCLNQKKHGKIRQFFNSFFSGMYAVIDKIIPSL